MAPGSFSERDILYASEIAFIVDDVSSTVTGLQDVFDLAQYRQGGDTFRALGDETGLLLVFQRGRNLSRGFGDPKLVRPSDCTTSSQWGEASSHLSTESRSPRPAARSHRAGGQGLQRRREKLRHLSEAIVAQPDVERLLVTSHRLVKTLMQVLASR